MSSAEEKLLQEDERAPFYVLHTTPNGLTISIVSLKSSPRYLGNGFALSHSSCIFYSFYSIKSTMRAVGKKSCHIMKQYETKLRVIKRHRGHKKFALSAAWCVSKRPRVTTTQGTHKFCVLWRDHTQGTWLYFWVHSTSLSYFITITYLRTWGANTNNTHFITTEKVYESCATAIKGVRVIFFLCLSSNYVTSTEKLLFGLVVFNRLEYSMIFWSIIASVDL